MEFETACPECDHEHTVDIRQSLDFYWNNTVNIHERAECEVCGCKWTMVIEAEVEFTVLRTETTFKPQKKNEFDPFDLDSYGDSNDPNQLSLL